jgi:NADPH2:quinone reductase
MKAIRLTRTGGPEALEYVETPTPRHAAHEVLVKAHTIGVNMPEVLVRRGTYDWMPPLPTIPGIEMSGTVEAVGAAVTKFRVGDRVYVSARELLHRCGCYAEYIAVHEDALFAVRADADLEIVASLASYQVAWHLLNSATRGFACESVLVTSAAGAIGTCCVQLARAAGKRVYAVASSREKAAFARENGADIAIAYHEEDWETKLGDAVGKRGIDLILDAVAGPEFSRLFKLAAPLGLVVQYGHMQGEVDGAAVYAAMRARLTDSLALRLFSMHTFDDNPPARRLCTEALLDLLARGAIRPAIRERLPLAEAARAHRLLESGQVLGKLVLKP